MDMPTILFALLATFCTTLVGAVWYSRLLFGDIWAKEAGLGKRYQQASSTLVIRTVANFIVEFMMALIFRAFMTQAHLVTASAIFGLGFLLFVGFMLPLLISDLLWSEKNPRLFAIHAGHRLALILVLCILGSIWQ